MLEAAGVATSHPFSSRAPKLYSPLPVVRYGLVCNLVDVAELVEVVGEVEFMVLEVCVTGSIGAVSSLSTVFDISPVSTVEGSCA